MDEYLNKYLKIEDIKTALFELVEKDKWLSQRTTKEIIKALGTVPRVEVSEDCISREDAVNALMSYFIPQTYTGEEVEQASKLARKIMASVPSVVPITEQSSMVGEWRKEYNGNGWNDYWDYTCPNCGKKYERADSVLYDSSFCPNCGKKMKGAEE